MTSSQKKYLISFDTDRVKEYIFATTDLKKIRGASSLLESLNKEDIINIIKKVCHDIGDGHIITAGGAAMAVVLTRESAQRVKMEVERLYREKTVTGTITGACLEIPEDDLNTAQFKEHVKRLSIKLRAAKDAKGYEITFPLKAYLRPCNACGRYPAVRPDPDDSEQALCTSCGIKYDYNESGKNHFRGYFEKLVSENRDKYPNWPNPFPKGFWPKDFNDIGHTSHPPNYMGFILADGNGIGSLLEEMQGFKQYHYFATELDQLMREITCNALLSELQKPHNNIAPFEILLMGGDDLMVVVPADAALKVALKIVEDFEVKATKLARSPEVGLSQDTHLSLSTGVVIAHDSFPIKAAHDLADDLLRSAKRKTSEDTEQHGAIDFMVVTEAGTAGLGFVRDKVLTEKSFVVPPPTGDEFRLTERPYTAAKLKELLDFIIKFKEGNFPTRSLHTMYDALFQPGIQAQLTTLTVLARAKEEHRALLMEFFQKVASVKPTDTYTYPWRREKVQHYSTPLGDLVEIYPFIKRSS